MEQVNRRQFGKFVLTAMAGVEGGALIASRSSDGRDTLEGNTARSAQEEDSTESKTNNDTVVRTLRSYERALNAGDVPAIVSLYHKGGIFMPQHIPAVVGSDAIRETYTNILKVIALDIDFSIDEVEIAGDVAWARTRSAGTVKVLESGESHPEGNQELFILKRAPGQEWKIWRYIFTTTNPRR